MKKQDKVFIIGLVVFIFIILLELLKALSFSQVKTQDTSNIYFYGIEDSEIKNPELLVYFLDNVNSGLNTSLTIYMVGDYEEDLMYGIIYEDNKFTLYTSINNQIVSTEYFDYLNSYNYKGYTYYFLSDDEELTDDVVEQYFMGNIFELFEIGRIKTEK